ncbi:putative leucine-rich repeat-containing protein DDB_G0290503, partial [Centruroides sculpturatus]|uniref:putative leucine-rich repeat-containing protein DDB_G0290503 n=1 Tax=Centruroides sculpturatus TaxID=218467 RepID=UPI000C6E216D
SAIKRLRRRTNFFTIEKYLDKSLKVSNLERKKITDDQDENSSRTLHCKENIFYNYSTPTSNNKQNTKNAHRHTLPKRKIQKKKVSEVSASPCFPDTIFKRRVSKLIPKEQKSYNLDKSTIYSQKEMKVFTSKNESIDSADVSELFVEETEDPYIFIASQNSPKKQKKKNFKSKILISNDKNSDLQKSDIKSYNKLNNKSINSIDSCIIVDDNCKVQDKISTNSNDKNHNENSDCDLFLTPALNIEQLKSKKKDLSISLSKMETRSVKRRKNSLKSQTSYSEENYIDWIEEISMAESHALVIKNETNCENKRDCQLSPSVINETQRMIIQSKNVVIGNFNEEFDLSTKGAISDVSNFTQLESIETDEINKNLSTQKASTHVELQKIPTVPGNKTSDIETNYGNESNSQKNELSSKIEVNNILKNENNFNDDKIIFSSEVFLNEKLSKSETEKCLINDEFQTDKSICKNNNENAKVEENTNHTFFLKNIQENEINKISSKTTTLISDKVNLEESFPPPTVPETLQPIVSSNKKSFITEDKNITVAQKQMDSAVNFSSFNLSNECNRSKNFTDITVTTTNNNDGGDDSEDEILYTPKINSDKPKRKTFCLEIETQDLKELVEYRNTLDLLTEVCSEFANSNKKSDHLPDEIKSTINETQNICKTLDSANKTDLELIRKSEFKEGKNYSNFPQNEIMTECEKTCEQLINFDKNISENTGNLFQLHEEPSTQSIGMHKTLSSSTPTLSLETRKSGIFKEFSKDTQTVNITIPLDNLMEITKTENRFIETNCPGCQCKIDIKKNENNLIITFIKNSGEVQTENHRSVDIENKQDCQLSPSIINEMQKTTIQNENAVIGNFNEEFHWDKEKTISCVSNNENRFTQLESIKIDKLNKNLDYKICKNSPISYSEDLLADLNKEISLDTTIKNKIYYSEINEENEIDKESIHGCLSDNSKISSERNKINLDNVNKISCENTSLDKKYDANDTEKIHNSSDKFQTSTITTDSDLLANVNKEIMKNVKNKINHSEIYELSEENKQEVYRDHDDIKTVTQTRNIDCIDINETEYENEKVLENVSSEENCNINEVDTEINNFQINTSALDTDDLTNLRKNCNANKINRRKTYNDKNNLKITSQVIEISDETSEQLDTEQFLVSSIPNKCNNLQNDKNNLLEKINRISQEDTPEEINQILGQNDTLITSSNRNLERFLNEMSCPSSDPDMIFAESLVAPLKNLQHPKQNQTTKINSIKGIHPLNVKLTVSQDKNEFIQNANKNKLDETINQDDLYNSKTFNDAKKTKNKINDSPKKESFSLKVNSHLSNSLTSRKNFNVSNDMGAQITPEKFKCQKNFQRIKTYISDSNSESDSDMSQEIIEDSKPKDTNIQNIIPENKNLICQTNSLLKNNASQVSLTINSENTASREYSNQSNIREKIRLDIQQMKEQIRQMEIQLQTSVCEGENKSLNAQTEEETVVTSDSEEGSDDLFSPIPPTPP